MTSYYNEFDPKAAAWLRELIRQGHIAPGDVDERDIRDVTPSELVRYTQCHFFAGIGVWSHALRNAGWPDDRPVWTGSCPCQPFSPAGTGDGFADERHLWPFWHYLISECRPAEVYGEQVADGGGEVWLDLVLADLEGSLYAAGPVDICAAGVGSPNIRQRLYFKAERMGEPIRHGLQGSAIAELRGTGRGQKGSEAGRAGGASGGMANTGREHGERGPEAEERRGAADPRGWEQDTIHDQSRGLLGGMADTQPADGRAERAIDGEASGRDGLGRSGDAGRLADTDGRNASAVSGRDGRNSDSLPGPVNGFWGDADWILCRDPDGPAWRPVEPGTFPLAHGAPARMGLLRGYGNAINAKVAQAVIEVSM